jgi:predicted peptidase
MRFPLLVVFPQAQPDKRWLHREMQDMAIAQLDETIREFNVDSQRIYLSGFSMGAIGAYRFAYRWPDKFAAVVAIAGAVETATSYPAETIDSDRRANPFVTAANPFEALAHRIRHLPIWIFHGAADETVPVEQSRRLVPALKAAGANVRYTEYEDTNHAGGAQKAYADPEMMTWLLAQRLPATTAAGPTAATAATARALHRNPATAKYFHFRRRIGRGRQGCCWMPCRGGRPE